MKNQAVLALENTVADISKLTSGFFRPNTMPENTLAQIYGANDSMPEFSLVAHDGRQIGPWVKCKDFVQDVFWSQANKVSYSLYGYSYNPTIEPAPFDSHFALALRWKGKSTSTMEKSAANIRKTVDTLESSLTWLDAKGKKSTGIPAELRSKVCDPVNGVIVVFGTAAWKRSIANISFFTWLLRSAFNNTSGELKDVSTTCPQKKDVYYFQSAKKYVDALKDKGPQHFKWDWFDHPSIGSVHNNGFVRWSGGSGY